MAAGNRPEPTGCRRAETTGGSLSALLCEQKEHKTLAVIAKQFPDSLDIRDATSHPKRKDAQAFHRFAK